MEDYSDYSAPELVRMLGSRFKDYRLKANMTQKEVAEMAGLSVLSVYRFENGAVTNISLRCGSACCLYPSSVEYTCHIR